MLVSVSLPAPPVAVPVARFAVTPLLLPEYEAVSTPAPPSSVSSPASPRRVSSPSPAEMMSAPDPPISTLVFASPSNVSARLLPVTFSKPLSVSLPAPVAAPAVRSTTTALVAPE